MAAPTCLPPQAPRRARAPLPAGTCDTHIHVFGEAAQYPLDPRRNYTPVPATLAQYREVMGACGIERAVLVQPSVYGTDNRSLLEGLREGGEAFRGIAVVEPTIADAELEAMHGLGVRGVRLNVVNPAVLGIDDALALAARTARLGWHLQVHVNLRDAGGAALLESIAARCPAPLVIDHMGRADPALPAPPVLLRLLEGGTTWVKLSAAYRLSRLGAPHYEDVLPLVRALVAANPDRLLWASDWPHSELFDAPPQDAELVDIVSAWLPDAALRRRVCVDNPARLYGYAPG
jgi:predicted TIM-barrel fold metal-dependent hydrolase